MIYDLYPSFSQIRIEIVRNFCRHITGDFVIFDGMILYLPRSIDSSEVREGRDKVKSYPADDR